MAREADITSAVTSYAGKGLAEKIMKSLDSCKSNLIRFKSGGVFLVLALIQSMLNPYPERQNRAQDDGTTTEFPEHLMCSECAVDEAKVRVTSHIQTYSLFF